MSAEVAVYVQRGYAKPTYARESYNVRGWPGLEMVCDALRRAGRRRAADAGRWDRPARRARSRRAAGIFLSSTLAILERVKEPICSNYLRACPVFSHPRKPMALK